MDKKRMAMKMVTIFVALIVCGMFFPDLARGADLSSDQGLDVSFGDVLIGAEEIITLTITNQSSESTFTLILLLNMDAACEFTYTGPNMVSGFAPGDTLDVQVAFKASAVGVCNAVLQIQYFGSGGLVEINFTGNGIEEVSETFEPIVIGNITTSVMDRPIPIDETTTTTLEEMIHECEDKFERRGQLMRCVAWTTGELKNEGLMTRQEKRELVRAAARVEWQKIIEKIKAQKKTRERSRGGRRFWWLCRSR
jgi:hypothetical protein